MWVNPAMYQTEDRFNPNFATISYRISPGSEVRGQAEALIAPQVQELNTDELDPEFFTTLINPGAITPSSTTSKHKSDTIDKTVDSGHLVKSSKELPSGTLGSPNRATPAPLPKSPTFEQILTWDVASESSSPCKKKHATPQTVRVGTSLVNPRPKYRPAPLQDSPEFVKSRLCPKFRPAPLQESTDPSATVSPLKKPTKVIRWETLKSLPDPKEVTPPVEPEFRPAEPVYPVRSPMRTDPPVEDFKTKLAEI